MHSRRDVIRTGAGVAGTGLLTALAGCSEVPVVGSYFDDAPNYADWTYDPGALDRRSVSATLMNVSAILGQDGVSNKSEMREEATSNYAGELAADDVEYRLSVGAAEVLTGSFDADGIVDAMGFSGDGSHGDFDLYTVDDEENAVVATDGDRLVKSSPFREVDARAEIELLIDTQSGDADRFVDNSDNLSTVDDEMADSGALVTARALSDSAAEEAGDDEIVASGGTGELDGADAAVEYFLLFKTADGADTERLESQLSEDDDTELNDISRDGRLVTIEYSVPVDQL